MDMSRELKRKTAAAEGAIREYFRKYNNTQSQIYDAMEYSLLSGGKRIRPVLAMSWCTLVGGEERQVLPYAVGLEMIHTYSLIHDDLPCMDDDDMRRGRPTSHKVYGEAMALLAGDALLTEAFRVMCRHNVLAPQTALQCIRLVADAAGTEGMLGGQVIDLLQTDAAADEARLEEKHALKTGALMECAVQLGVAAGGGSTEDTDNAKRYAKNLGLAFQIKDDILDVEGDESVLGKPIGSDAEGRKSTFVTLCGLSGAKRALERYTQEAIQALSAYGEDAAFLRWLAGYLLNRDK